jgi:hypothetical protein
VQAKVVPEIERANEQVTVVYEALFGSIGTASSRVAVSPVVAGTAFSGLSILEMLVYSSVGALETEPEEFLKTDLHIAADRQPIFLSLVERKQ